MFSISVCFVFLTFLYSVELQQGTGPQKKCTCISKTFCEPVDDWNVGKEVLVVTNRSSDYKKWMWEAFTTVIEWDNNLDSSLTDQLMCFAHSQGKKYGFYINDFPTDEDVATQMSSTIWYKRADVVVINLLDYLGNCSYAADNVDGMIAHTNTILRGIKKKIVAKILCLMPWKPPCYETNCDLAPALAKLCDGVIFSPESYNTYCVETCTAKPTVSYSKIQIGIAEYRARGFNKSQLLLGIPWHGYNYTCQNDDQVDKWSGHFVCHLKTTTDNSTGNSVQVCDVEGSRRRMSVGSLAGRVPEMALLDSTYSEVDQTPFLVNTSKIGNKSQHYMTWFEDIGSLMTKYEVVNKFDIKGCVIFTADDLSYTKVKTNKEFDDHMWAWMIHSILSTGTPIKQESKMNFAGTVAGVAVGMFLLGFLLGALILCIIFRRQRKLRPPFSHDRLEDDYKDEFDHNEL